jgi:hypothetical protein
MDTKKLADSIINDIKKIDILDLTAFGSDEMKEAISEFNRIYEQAVSKAFVTEVPSDTKFRLIKRIIGKLIRTYTIQQTKFNCKIIELVKEQQRIILKSHKLIEELVLKTKNNGN